MKKILVLVAFLIFINNQTKAQFQVRVGATFNLGGVQFYVGNDGYYYSDYYSNMGYPGVPPGCYYWRGQYYRVPFGYYCPDPYSLPILIPQGCSGNGYYGYNQPRQNYGYDRYYNNGNCNNGYNNSYPRNNCNNDYYNNYNSRRYNHHHHRNRGNW